MKKLKKLLIFMTAAVMLFACSSCKKVVDGCVITEAVALVEFYDADGNVASTNEVTIQLYNNNAPKTVKHVKNLINKKYYDGSALSVVGSDTTKGFVQVGNYYYDENGVWTEKAYSYGTVADESGRVITNQKLTASSGSIVLRHDFKQTAGVDRHDTGKGTLMFMLSGLDDVSADDFAVIGKFLSNDGDSAVSSSASNIDETDRSGLSSFAIINSVIDYRVNEEKDANQPTVTNKTTVWYTEYNAILGKTEDNVAYKYLKRVEVVDDGGTTTTKYYKGTTQSDISLELSTEDTTEIKDLFSVNNSGGFKADFYDFMLIPYRQIVVKSIRIK